MAGKRNWSTAISNKRGEPTTSRRHKPDYYILVLAAILLTVGLIVVFSISPGLAASQGVSEQHFIVKQIIDVLMGAIAFAVAAHFPIRAWARLARPLMVAAVIFSAIVMFTPVDNIYQAHRWIRAGGISFQVAELIKLALLFWVAGFLTRQWKAGKLADFKATIQPLLIILLAIGVVVAKFQSDLGSAAVMIAMVGLMAYNVGIPLRKIAMIGGLVMIIGLVAIGSSDYRRERLVTYLNPEADCLNTGYQACQALRSVGSGGVFGLGLGHSVQAYGYLPEASDDSIFAIIAEKFGFIGSVGLVLVYGLFIVRFKRIIERTSDQYARLVVVGVLAWMSTQMIVNVGAMTGLLPLKGITLPLISQGGTSLVFLTAALGVVFNISRYTNYNATEPTDSQSTGFGADRRGIRRPHNPVVVARPRS